jgi:hypothetical protein
MPMIRNIRTAIAEVPETVEQARRSLDQLDGGVRRANTTMGLLAIVATLALILATVALVRSEAISRAGR